MSVRSCLLALGFASCAAEPGAPRAPLPVERSLDPRGATGADGPRGPTLAMDASVRLEDGLEPAILMPGKGSEDTVVARAGAQPIRKAHVYDRLLDSDPTRARKLVDVLVLDSLIAEEALRHGIRVERAKIESMAEREQKQLAEQVQRDFGGRLTFAAYLERQLAMTPEEYRRWLVLNLARKLYREYVARYTALLQERVQVRYLVTSDEKVVRDARERAIAGADFASLCTRWSEDDLRQEGGLLPPFGRGFQHPVAKAAFGLEPGQVSEPLPYERDGAQKWYLVYCTRRLPARVVGFAEVRAELDAAIEAEPMSPFEFDAFYLSLRAAAEKLPMVDTKR